MGIVVEFNPDLALRNIDEFRKGKRLEEECIPENLEEGNTYPFLKMGQRNYWLEGELPLLETDGRQNLSRPIASIVIKETSHFMKGDELYTKGSYEVVEVFEDDEIHFNGFAKV